MAEDKVAGDLYVEITSSVQGASRALNTIITKLETLQKLLNGIDTSRLSQMTNMLNSVNGGGIGSSGGGSRPSGGSSGGGGGSGSADRSLRNTFLNLMRWTSVIRLAKRFGRAMSDIAQAGADYTETLNLWTVAMRGHNEEATKFVNKMNEAYGVSKETLMNSQAIFKNMLGSLGQISDTMAYQLSEGITQMALDYASLYNVSIESAMTKFQAALAGQVRPIRSVSGYDITETTLFQLYEQLGGTKTMRQLTRTEKQLLSIYAIFNQMDRSGAVGDMKKTIESFANQSRIMAENFKDVKAYAGSLLTNFLENAKILQGVNIALAYMKGVLEAIATTTNAIKKFDTVDPFADMEESAKNTLDVTKNLSSTLLDFDKFRSLQEQSSSYETENIDETLLSAVSKYDTILEQAKLKSVEIANEWLAIVGITKNAETGVVEVSDKAKGLISIFGLLGSFFTSAAIVVGAQTFLKIITKLIGSSTTLGVVLKSTFSLKNIGIMAIASALIYMFNTNEKFRESVFKLFDALGGVLQSVLNPLTKVLGFTGNALAKILDIIAPILGFVLDVISAVVEFTNKIGILIPMLITLFVSLNIINRIKSIYTALESLLKIIFGFNIEISKLSKSTTILLTTGIVALVGGIASLVTAWDDMGGWQRAITIVSALTAAIIGAWVAIKAFSMSLPAAIGLGAALAGTVLTIGSQLGKNSVTKFANGGLPDKGTMFLAGEAGAEIVYNTPSGQSGVVNVQQIKQAMYQALVEYGSSHSGGEGDIVVKVGEEEIFRASRKGAKKVGLDYVKAR